MSFIHVSIVGHFDLSTVEWLRTRPLPVPTRVIVEEEARVLLATFVEEVEQCVSFDDGCAWCEWSAGRSGDERERIYEYAERLADQEGAVILETPGWVRYPPEAARRFNEAIRAWQENRERA